MKIYLFSSITIKTTSKLQPYKILFLTRDIKCANLGPTTHSRSVKWDFTENLVPTPCPKVDIEAKRILPFLHNRLTGMCVYVPTPDVSMFDLTLRFDEDDDAVIAAQKEKVVLYFQCTCHPKLF